MFALSNAAEGHKEASLGVLLYLPEGEESPVVECPMFGSWVCSCCPFLTACPNEEHGGDISSIAES